MKYEPLKNTVMKTIKLSFLFIVFVLLTCNISRAQRTVHQELVGTIPGYDFGPEIGIISGTITYHFMYKISKDGYIENIHYNLTDVALVNDRGETVRLTDTGNDNYNYMGNWQFFNTINGSNQGAVTYNVSDGWLDSVMPPSDQMPTEGRYNELSWKFWIKGKQLRLGALVLFHMNANGDITVNVVKTFAD